MLVLSAFSRVHEVSVLVPRHATARPSCLPPPHGAGRAHATSRLTPARTEAACSRRCLPRAAPPPPGPINAGTSRAASSPASRRR